MKRVFHSLVCSGLLSLAIPAAAELPGGGQVVSGSGSIVESGDLLTVHQHTGKLGLNWSSFSIGPDNSVQFVQPDGSSIALNRIIGSDGSEIMGRLSANGQVFLINPNGVLFGSDAQVDAGGLVASTLDLSHADFAAGNMTFSGTGGRVINYGSLAADRGYLALLGAQVSNEGTMQATLGQVALAAGSQVTLDFAGDRLLNVGVDAAAVDALVENHQLIQADGGRVMMTARATDALLDTVVNNEGVVQAQTLAERDGVIMLLGDMEQGVVNVDGVLDASAPDGGDGGFVETSGAHVKVADGARITTFAPHGETGEWLVDPQDYTIAASGGDITGALLSTMLASTNVTLESVDGATLGNGDLFVDDPVSWSAATTLTLSAERNVDVNQAINASGAGNLLLRADSGASGTGTVNFGASGSITMAGGRADLYYNPTSYATPTDYSGDISGTYTAWMLVNDVNQLQDMSTNLAGDYALGVDIDASTTSGWNAGAGFDPVGDNSTPFTGQFDGLGHVISDLFISRSSESHVGLFGSVDSAGRVSNVGLMGGSVTGSSFTGALIGHNYGIASNAFSTLDVSSPWFYVGGLVGWNEGTVANSYATGDVAGNNMVGGLIGRTADSSAISNSYATGLVTYSGSIGGGFLGYGDSGYTLVDSVWNTVTSGQAVGVGNYTGHPGLTGLTSAQMLDAANYSTWDNSVWRIYDGNTTPLLKVFMSPVTVTANDDSKTYDAAAYSGSPGVVYSDPSVAASLSGTLSYSSPGINAGTHALSATGLYSDQQGYDITFVDGTLTISQAVISVSTSDVTRTYDGTTAASGVAVLSAGTLFGTDSLSGGTFTFDNRHVGTGKTVTTSGVDVIDGNSGGNYAVTYVDNTSSIINPAALTVSTSDVERAYDGTTDASGSAQVASGTLYGSDSLSGGSFAFIDGNAGSNKTVTVTGVTANDGNGGNNYTIAYVDNTTSTINRATLTISTSDVVKTYDGTTSADGTAQVVGGTLFGTDTVSGGEFAFADAGAGTGKSVTVTGATVSDGNGGGNYLVTYVDNTTSTIERATLTITADDQVIIAGDPIPALTATAIGLVVGDSNGIITGLGTAATSSSPIGDYTIDASGASAGPNYTIAAANNGLLTITPWESSVVDDVVGDSIGDAVDDSIGDAGDDSTGDDDDLLSDISIALETGTDRERNSDISLRFGHITVNVVDGGIHVPVAAASTCLSGLRNGDSSAADCIVEVRREVRQL